MHRRPWQFGLRGLLLTTTASCVFFAGLSSAEAAMIVCFLGVALQLVGFVALVLSTVQRPDQISELQDCVIEVGVLVGTLVTAFGVLCRLVHLQG